MKDKIKEVFWCFDWEIFIRVCCVGICITTFTSGFLLIAIYETWWPILLWIVSTICLAISLAII